MSTEMLATSKSKRRWYQFSLRTLIVFTALVAIGCGWFVERLHQAGQRRQAVEAIRAMGGTEFSGPPDDSLGIYLPDKLATDAGLANLKDIPQLRRLFLYDTDISDAGLALPKPVRHWSLTTLREKLIKIGAKVTRHSKYVTFQLARWL